MRRESSSDFLFSKRQVRRFRAPPAVRSSTPVEEREQAVSDPAPLRSGRCGWAWLRHRRGGAARCVGAHSRGSLARVGGGLPAPNERARKSRRRLPQGGRFPVRLAALARRPPAQTRRLQSAQQTSLRLAPGGALAGGLLKRPHCRGRACSMPGLKAGRRARAWRTNFSFLSRRIFISSP